MSKPRKSWEPEYRFGGDRTSWYSPKPLGENDNVWRAKIKKPKPRKKK